MKIKNCILVNGKHSISVNCSHSKGTASFKYYGIKPLIAISQMVMKSTQTYKMVNSYMNNTSKKVSRLRFEVTSCRYRSQGYQKVSCVVHHTVQCQDRIYGRQLVDGNISKWWSIVIRTQRTTPTTFLFRNTRCWLVW